MEGKIKVLRELGWYDKIYKNLSKVKFLSLTYNFRMKKKKRRYIV